MDETRKITFEGGKEFSIQNNLDYFCEASAKTGFNAKNIFLEASKRLYVQNLEYQKQSRSSGSNELSIAYKQLMVPIIEFEDEKNKRTCC